MEGLVAISVKNVQKDQRKRKRWTFSVAKNVISIVVKTVGTKIFPRILFASKEDITANSKKAIVKVTIAFSAAKKTVRVCGAAKRKIVNTTLARIAFKRKK